MVVEAVAAVGLTAAVLQFVHFTAKVAQKSHEVHKTTDGATKEHIELREFAAGFDRFNSRLKATIYRVRKEESDLSVEERDLIVVATKCQLVCQEFRDALEALIRRNPDKRYGSLRQALNIIWNGKKVEDKLTKLRVAQEELMRQLQLVY